jgi:glycosyltransferase involved in cell wall biosynthesis
MANKTVPNRVSLIIAAYNCQATIASAVESCLSQTYPDTEVVVVNDGSKDGTREELQKFGERVLVVDQPNGGLANARNTGVKFATGEFLAWMDADDLVEPNRAALQVAVMRELGIVLVSSNFSAFTDDKPVLMHNYIETYYRSVNKLGGVAAIYPHLAPRSAGVASEPLVRIGECYEALLTGNFVHPGTVMVRRNLFDEIGYFDEKLRYSSDYDLILRAARKGRFAFIESEMLRYRLSPTQMSHMAGAQIPLETITIIDKVRRNDPDVYARNEAFLGQKVASQLLHAAEGAIPVSRLRALTLFIRAQRERALFGESLKVFAKIITPQFAIQFVKRTAWRLGLLP